MGPWPGPEWVVLLPTPTVVTTGCNHQKLWSHSPAQSPEWRATGPHNPWGPRLKGAQKRRWRQPACPDDLQASGSSSRGPDLAGEVSILGDGRESCHPTSPPPGTAIGPGILHHQAGMTKRGQAGSGLHRSHPPHSSPQSP